MADRGSAVVAFYRQRRALVWVIGVAVLAFGVVVYLGSQDSDEGLVADGAAPDGTAVESGDSPVVLREPDDERAMGELDAPVVVVEWVDLRCPFCALFSRQTLPALIDQYVDTGLVRYEVRDVALFGEESLDAAVAARAAGEQGRFHEFLTTVYDAAPEGEQADLPRAQLVEFAEQAGVEDLDRFESDLDREDLRRGVQQSTSTAGRLGVTVVPFFVIGEVAFSGAQSLEVFEEVIDEHLAQMDIEPAEQ